MTTTIGDVITSSFSSNATGECNPIQRLDLIGYAIVVVVQILWNFLILLAIITKRHQLKHNRVYLYVTNVVAANIFLGALMLYTILAYLIPIERSSGSSTGYKLDYENPSHVAIVNWWVFRIALMVGMFLIMSGSVVALIQGITDSAIFVSRSGGANSRLNMQQIVTTTNEFSKLKSILTKRNIAIARIVSTWLFPLIYTLLALGWNCTRYCMCLPAYYKKQDDCLTENNVHKCSSVWVPLAKGHLLLSVAIWILLLFIMTLFLVSVIAKYKSATITTRSPEETSPCENGTTSPQDCRRSLYKPTWNLKVLFKTKAPFHPTIKLLIALSATYTACTAPIMICFAVDSLVKDITIVSHEAVTVTSALLSLYCYICPVFLIAYMPGLKSAVLGFLLSCPCTTTTVKQKTNGSATAARIQNENEENTSL